MTLFQIVLEQIKMLHVMESDEFLQLKRDTQGWEEKCKADDSNKLQQLYAKLHEGIAFRIASPFILVFMKRWFDNMLNGKPDERDEYLG